jgi:hypothetical protein
VDDYAEVARPNPLSTAPVKLQFVGGTWQYRAVLTASQKRERVAVITSVSVPVQLAFMSAVLVQLVVLHLVDRVCASLPIDLAGRHLRPPPPHSHTCVSVSRIQEAFYTT